MRLLIAIATLLASVAVSAGELDGKALICKSTEDWSLYWEFKDGTAIGTEIVTRGSKAVADEFGGFADKTYVTRPTEVIWWKTYHLHRATLVAEYKDGDVAYFEDQCELATSLDSFRATRETERLEKQKAIDEEMKDNKI